MMNESKPSLDYTALLQQYDIEALAKDANQAYETLEDLKKQGRYAEAEILNNAIVDKMHEIERERLN